MLVMTPHGANVVAFYVTHVRNDPLLLRSHPLPVLAYRYGTEPLLSRCSSDFVAR